MNDALILFVLKQDLEILHDEKDDYLQVLIETALEEIQREGVALNEEKYADNALVASYAAWLYRKRGANDTEMPRFLRYMLNNRLFSQKAGAGE